MLREGGLPRSLHIEMAVQERQDERCKEPTSAEHSGDVYRESVVLGGCNGANNFPSPNPHVTAATSFGASLAVVHERAEEPREKVHPQQNCDPTETLRLPRSRWARDRPPTEYQARDKNEPENHHSNVKHEEGCERARKRGTSKGHNVCGSSCARYTETGSGEKAARLPEDFQIGEHREEWMRPNANYALTFWREEDAITAAARGLMSCRAA